MVKPKTTQRRPAQTMKSRTYDKNDSRTTKTSKINGVKKGRVVTPPKGAVSINKNNFIHIVSDMLPCCCFR